MNGNKKQDILGITTRAVKVLLAVLLLFCSFVFIYFGLINRGNVVEKESVRYIEDWTFISDEGSEQVLTATLPEDVKDNEYLFFDTRKSVSVYIDGEFRKDFVEERDVNIPAGSTQRFIFAVPLKGSDSGKTVTVERHSVQLVDREAPDFFIGTRSGAVNSLLRESGNSFFLSLIVMIFSFVAFIVSVFLRIWYRHKIDLMYGALAIFTIAAWLITESFLFPFVFGVYHVNGLLSFMLCTIIPLPLAVYLVSVQNYRYKITMTVMMIIALLNSVGWTFLHLTGILLIYNAIDAANTVLVILALSGIAILLLDAFKGNTHTYRYTFIGFMGFLVGCLIELTSVFLELTFIKTTVPMVVGLGFFLAFIVIQQVHDLRTISIEKQHAIDISEAKTRFLASMSHEIRTPINSILGMNEMILRENNDKEIEEYSRNIKTSGKMLLMLVNDVLDFTKIESGKMDIKEGGFLMADVLYDVMSMIKERSEEKDLELKTEIEGEVPNGLISDEFRIRQILVNLLNNAVKYTEKGTICLKVGGSYTEEGYNLSLSVKDTGKGIRKEDQEHLFEAFSRADLKSNANIEGTGLGLAIVKSIVDSMNGELGVLSEFGVGSEFWVKLPVKYNSKDPLRDGFMNRKTEPAAASEASSFTAPNARILAVDDNQSNLKIVKLFLKRNGVVPDLCTSGTAAIAKCKEKKYDLILLDHMMPEPDGIETLHAIREDEDSLNKDTKAVVLTANAVAGSREMYMQEGFDDYLTKPLDPRILEITVRNMLPPELVSVENDTKTDPETEKTVVEADSSVPEKTGLSSMKGMDYETALTFCAGDEDLLREIVSDIADEGPVRADRMKKNLEAEDIKAYAIDAHSIKSSMATIGLKDFSEKAKKHELAAKANETEFVYGDVDTFLNEYLELCEELKKLSL